METSQGFVHQALIYSSGEEFLSATIPFIQAGVANSEQVIVATDPAKLALLGDALGDAAEQVRFKDHATWYDAPARRLSEFYYLCREQQQAGVGPMRVVGEPVWSGRSSAQIREWKRYESLANVVYASFPVLALCPYDARALPSSILADVCRTHPELVNGSRSEPSAQFVDTPTFLRDLDEEELPQPQAPVSAQLAFHGDLAGLRRFIVKEARSAGLGREKSVELEWVANEIATNVLRHGFGRATVRTWRGVTEFICEISDSGRGIEDPLAGHLPPAPDQEFGSGLWLAHQLCNVVDVRSSTSGVMVRLHVMLNQLG
jgi:anti-sigma regulatory factor (Ser/Thr protein kinase)